MNLSSRGRLPSLASDTAEDAMEHGLVFLSHNDILDAENNFLDGQYQLDIVPTTWNEGSGFAHDSLWGPTWNGSSGSGDELEQKWNDIENAFSGTERRLCQLYTCATPNEPSNYKEAANGQFDTDFANFAQELVNRGMEDTIMRPSGEHNQDWSKRFPIDPDTGEDAPQQYADAFARMVAAFESVSGGDFTYLYSPAGNSLGITEEAWPVDSQYWPSGQEPPTVVWSLYNASWVWDQYTDDEIRDMYGTQQYQDVSQEAWDQQLKGKFDLGTDFAASKGAPIATAEWGPASIDPTRYPAGGGDDPYYMERAFDYFEANDFEFQCVWNVDSNTNGSHAIWPPDVADLEESAAVWKDRVLN